MRVLSMKLICIPNIIGFCAGLTLACIVPLVSLTLLSGEPPAHDSSGTIRWTDLGREVKIIGSLGEPLGTVVSIEVEMVSGRLVDKYKYPDRFMMRIIQISGRLVSEEVTLPYVFFSNAGWRNGPAAGSLYALEQELRYRAPNAQRLAELEGVYERRRFELLVFETGGFGGLPRENLPDMIEAVPGERFRFYPSVVVLVEKGSEASDEESEE
jgi:hypothetical protein